jgi:hypothetical protein
MKYLSSIVCLATAAIALSLTSCAQKKQPEFQQQPVNDGSTAEAPQTQAAVKTTVCILDGVPVREEPNKKGKYISSINLGECVRYLNKTEKDADDKDREYLKVQLSDGKTGWATAWGLIRDAEIGALKDSVVIYKRPDLLTMTKVRFHEMDVIAVLQEKDDWAEVVGEGKKKSGWINRHQITKVKEDVAVAVVANQKIRESGNLSEIDRMKAVVSVAPYQDSYFITRIKEKLAALDQSQVAPAQTETAPAVESSDMAGETDSGASD